MAPYLVMPRFVARKPQVLVSTSYKVMYSSLVESGLKEISDSDLADCLRIPETRHLLAVRDPYQKLASFFADKLRQDLQRDGGEWQNCQRMFFSYVGVEECDSFSDIRKALLCLSFDEFIDYLPLLREVHLDPQFDMLRVGELDLTNSTDVFRIETHARDFWRHAGVEEPPHANKTSARLDPLELNRARLDIVNTIYSQDFYQFGYAMH